MKKVSCFLIYFYLKMTSNAVASSIVHKTGIKHPFDVNCLHAGSAASFLHISVGSLLVVSLEI